MKFIKLILIAYFVFFYSSTFAYADDQEQLNMKLAEAALVGSLEVVKNTLVNGADINTKIKFDTTPLIFASKEGHMAIVKLLLEAKADVDVSNFRGFTSLIFASKEGYAEIVKLLLEAKADVNAATDNGATPLIIASQNGHTEVVKLLLEANADVNATLNSWGKDYTALSIAQRFGRHPTIKLLKEYGAK